jgi:ribosomal protein S18 acetylase RimI-like enzyme
MRTQTELASGRTAAQIRQADAADLAALRDFFAGLSLRTRFLRFFAPITPSLAMLRCLAGGPGHVDAVIATHGGAIIGHAMAADQTADQTGPDGGAMTDIGVVVADAWQSQGVGSALVRALIARAQARGVTSIAMDVLPDNPQVLAMITSHWPAARTDHGADWVTVQVRLDPPGPSSAGVTVSGWRRGRRPGRVATSHARRRTERAPLAGTTS